MKIVRREQWLIELCRGKSVLHLGCTDTPMTEEKLAAGRLLHQKLLAVARHVVGVDIDQDALALLRDKGNISDLYAHNIEHLNTLPVKEPFDVILAGEVVEHLNNVGAFIDSCVSILSEHETLILTVPNAFSVKRFLVACVGRTENVHPDHTAYFSPSTLTRIAARNGLRIAAMYGYIWENPTIGNHIANLLARTIIAVSGSPLLADGLIAGATAFSIQIARNADALQGSCSLCDDCLAPNLESTGSTVRRNYPDANDICNGIQLVRRATSSLRA